MKQPLLPRFFLMSLLCGASMLSSGCISGCTTLFKPYEKRARAVLLPTAGNAARGTVAFVERADGMQVSYSIQGLDRKSTRLNSSHQIISYAVFCLKKKKKK